MLGTRLSPHRTHTHTSLRPSHSYFDCTQPSRYIAALASTRMALLPQTQEACMHMYMRTRPDTHPQDKNKTLVAKWHYKTPT